MFNVCLLLICVKPVMHVFFFTMTAVDLSQTLHGNLVFAPPSSGRWQIISLSAQRRSLLESVGTIRCLDDTYSVSQQGACHPVKSRSCWRGWTCMRSAQHIRKCTANSTLRRIHGENKNTSSIVVPVVGHLGRAAAGSVRWTNGEKWEYIKWQKL